MFIVPPPQLKLVQGRSVCCFQLLIWKHHVGLDKTTVIDTKINPKIRVSESHLKALTINSASEMLHCTPLMFFIWSFKSLASFSSLSSRLFVVLKTTWVFPLLSSPRLGSSIADCLFVFACILLFSGVVSFTAPKSLPVSLADLPKGYTNKHHMSLRLTQVKEHRL